MNKNYTLEMYIAATQKWEDSGKFFASVAQALFYAGNVGGYRTSDGLRIQVAKVKADARAEGKAEAKKSETPVEAKKAEAPAKAKAPEASKPVEAPKPAEKAPEIKVVVGTHTDPKPADKPIIKEVGANYGKY